MYREYKMKKGYLKIIAAILIWGLLCPQAIWAEEQPSEIGESEGEIQLISFEKFEDMKEREKELLEDCEKIKEQQEGKDEIEFGYIMDASGDLAQLTMAADNLTVVVNNVLESEVEERESESTDSVITPALLNNDESYIADVDIKGIDKTSSELLEIFGDESDNTNRIKEDISILLKIHESALKKFYIDAAPYYNKLESTLKKAQWLWREQGIDPHLYYAGADGVLDDSELRRMVDESIIYLYKNIPNGGQRDNILALEKDLRAQYIDPAFEAYKRELKEASSAFYKRVEEAIKPFMNPFINKIDGQIEVIITLPQKSAE